MTKTAHFEKAAADIQLARQVAEHKSMFFAEKNETGNKIDYLAAVSGSLRLIPEGASLMALEQDYVAMREDGLLALDQPEFSEVLDRCRDIENRVN
jgi:hypothetical protein